MKNVKVISRVAPYKALVQLETRELAERVISTLHNAKTEFGRFKVFASNKTYISLEKTIKQIIEEGEAEEGRRRTRGCEENSKSSFEEGRRSPALPYEEVSLPLRNDKQQHASIDSGKHTSPLQRPSTDFENKKCGAKICSEIVVRGTKRSTRGESSVYVKATGLDASTASQVLQSVSERVEVLSAELELTKNVLFIDFKSKSDAQAIASTLHATRHNGKRLTVKLCQNFEQLLDASFASKPGTTRNSLTHSNSGLAHHGSWGLVIPDAPYEISLERLVCLLGKYVMPTHAAEYMSKSTGRRALAVEYSSRAQATEAMAALQTKTGASPHGLGGLVRLQFCDGTF